MANAVSIQIKDRSKTAICRETLALCGRYDVTVEGMTGNGILVLYNPKELPKLWPFHPDATWAAQELAYDTNRLYGYCLLTAGQSAAASPLDLSMKPLVEKLTKTHRMNDVVNVAFSVIETNVGVLGTGSLPVLVVPPHGYNTSDQSFISFKGDKGDTGSAAGFGSITAQANTLTPGSQATARVDAIGPDTAKAFAFTFGIPKGEKGDTGDAAGFGTPTATANQLGEHAAPTAGVIASGPSTAKQFAFTFGIPRGIMPKPSVGNVTEVTPSGTTAVSMRGQGSEYPILDFWLKRGESAYEVAVRNGFDGDEAAWLDSLVGGYTLKLERSIATLTDAVATLTKMVFGHEMEIDGKLRDIEIVENEFGEKTLKVRQ